MIIVMKGGIPKEQVHDVIRTIEELGYQPHVIWGTPTHRHRRGRG